MRYGGLTMLRVKLHSRRSGNVGQVPARKSLHNLDGFTKQQPADVIFSFIVKLLDRKGSWLMK